MPLRLFPSSLLVASLLLFVSNAAAEAAAPPPARTAPAEAAPDASSATAAPRTVLLADLGLHIVAVGAQRVVSPRIALQASIGLYVPWTQTKNTFGVSGDDHAADTSGGALKTGDPSGGMIRLRPFFYLGERALRGVWLSPFVQGGFVTADRAGVSRTGPAVALGGSVGYAWLLAEHLHLSLGAGAQVHGAKVPGGSGFPTFGQLFPQIDIAVGWAFSPLVGSPLHEGSRPSRIIRYNVLRAIPKRRAAADTLPATSASVSLASFHLS